MEDETNVRSTESLHRAFISFSNCTNRNVNIYWMNYNAVPIHYTKLRPLDTTIVNTYQTHPWIFCDEITGERLQVNFNNVFWPQPWYLRNIDLNSMTIKREVIEIHFPLRTLKMNALWKVFSLIKCKGDIEQLELPQSLENDLLKCFLEKLTTLGGKEK